MAFRQPTFQAPQRTYAAPEETIVNTSSYQPEQPLEDSQEWILFSAAPASTSYHTQTTSTDRTRRTLGHSRNSAFGSLDTAARSYEYDEEGSEQTEGALEDEEDAELDSLDSHLHEFRADPSVYQEEDLNASSNPVLPTHDGLGSFRINQTTMNEGVQEHLYAFEQYNPRRVKRRRESLEIGQLALENERAADLERTRRIEAWRMEQSRALLDEIQRESRRRKQSMSSERRSLLNDIDDAEAASLNEGPDAARGAADVENEGFWSRITRRVIRDLMGIDDTTLSILFGEALPQEDELSTTPTASRAIAHIDDMKQDSWEYRLLERVARELGLLINQLSDHPGAFSTYMQMRTAPLPYAGLPIIPESAQNESTDRRPSIMTASTPQFEPTLGQTHAQTPAMNIPGVSDSQEIDMDATPRNKFPIHDHEREFSKEEWEKQLDIKMVFRYLRSRFTSRPTSPEPPLHRTTSRPSPTSAGIEQLDQARAARVRRHHPLVSHERPRQERPRTFKVSIPTGMHSATGSGLHSPILHRRSSSSCASFKREKMLATLAAGSVKSGSRGSSRHYWDFPAGSIGSGSLVASGGGMGAWGEV